MDANQFPRFSPLNSTAFPSRPLRPVGSPTPPLSPPIELLRSRAGASVGASAARSPRLLLHGPFLCAQWVKCTGNAGENSIKRIVFFVLLQVTCTKTGSKWSSLLEHDSHPRYPRSQPVPKLRDSLRRLSTRDSGVKHVHLGNMALAGQLRPFDPLVSGLLCTLRRCVRCWSVARVPARFAPPRRGCGHPSLAGDRC